MPLYPAFGLSNARSCIARIEVACRSADLVAGGRLMASAKDSNATVLHPAYIRLWSLGFRALLSTSSSRVWLLLSRDSAALELA